MEEEGEWIMVQRPAERELWNPSGVVGDGESSRPLKIVFKDAAKHWTDALPIGNGRLGAMVWGGVNTETLNLNDECRIEEDGEQRRMRSQMNARFEEQERGNFDPVESTKLIEEG